MSVVVDVVAAVLILSGAVVAVIAALGLHTMPDVYARMHVATKPATFGITLCLTGAALLADSTSMVTKLVLAIVFQLVTTPAAGHLLGRAAHAARAPVSGHTFVDELRPLPADGEPDGNGTRPAPSFSRPLNPPTRKDREP